MFKLDLAFDDELIDTLAEKIANRSLEMIVEQINSMNKNNLPPMLTKKQLEELLNIKHAKASELLNRPDFPVFREAGVLVPTHMLFKWIEKNTRWVEENTNYFNKKVI